MENIIKKIKRMFAPKVQIFLYHHIGLNDELEEAMNTNPDVFRKQIKAFKRKGYKFVKIEEIYEMYQTKKEVKEKIVCITFDDGYIDIYENAYKIMKEEKVVGSVFIIQDKVGEYGYMDIEQLRKIDNTISCYSHGKSHINFRKEQEKGMSDEEIVEYAISPIHFLRENIDEVKKKNKLEKVEKPEKQTIKMEERPYIFCYPYGAYNQKTEEILEKAGVYRVHTDNIVNIKKDILKERRCHREYILRQGYLKTFLKKIYRSFRYYGFKERI